MRLAFADHLMRTCRVPLSEPVTGEALAAGYGYLPSLGVVPAIIEGESGWRWMLSSVAEGARGVEPQWLTAIGSEWHDSTRSLVLLVHGSLSPDELTAVNLQMQAGAAIGRVVPGGFELRWREQPNASLFTFEAFWESFAEHVPDGGRRAPAPDRPEIWPNAEHLASQGDL